MVEFRWLKISDTKSSPYGYEMVLQYRMMEGPKGEQWWGKWITVPTVSEPNNGVFYG